MVEITSPRNPLLQKIRKATAAGRPTEESLVVAEGPHLLEEALRGTWRIEQVLTTAAARDKYADLLQRTDAEIVEVGTRALESVAATEHSQQLIALLQPSIWNWSDVVGHQSLLVALDVIQDPGNAGTIVRSAEAFGATGVVFLKGSAHVANGRLLRASAGSIFRMPFLEQMSVPEFLSNAERSGLKVYALDARAELPVTAVDMTQPVALVAGNEGAGVSAELRSRVMCISIPTSHVESVNAAVSCSVTLFVAQQQRKAA